MTRETYNLTKTRQDILSELLKRPQNITELSNNTKLGRATIYHHLNHLKSINLIREEIQHKIHGNPVLIYFNIPDNLKNSIIKIIDYVENLRKNKHKAPSTKEKIKNDLNMSDNDFELAYDILDLYRGVGILITKEGYKLKKFLSKNEKL